jgi:hypothetical protein
MLDYPGRPTLVTLDNNSSQPTPGLLGHIPPMQTRPFNLMMQGSLGGSLLQDSAVRGSSGGGGSGGGSSRQLAAQWDEELLVDVPPELLAAADGLLLLEVLQLPSGFQQYKVRAGWQVGRPCTSTASTHSMHACTRMHSPQGRPGAPPWSCTLCICTLPAAACV